MVRVVLPGTLKQYTGGVTELDADAATIRQLFQVLGDKFPDIAPHLADGMAVAIDGQIYQDALLQPIPNNSEVHIIPKIAGGAGSCPLSLLRMQPSYIGPANFGIKNG